MGFRTCGASAKTGKGRRSGERDLRYQTHHKPTVKGNGRRSGKRDLRYQSRGIAIDLAYGFVLAGIFLLLYASLPGGVGWAKGISFGLLAWFFGVVMASVSSWMMFNVPAATLIYSLLTRLGEMLALGILYGLTLRPKTT